MAPQFIPSWGEHEKDLRSEDDAVSEKAADAFEAKRNNEMKTSQKARDWENGRKKEYFGNKREYVKKRDAIDRDPSKKTIAKMLDGGNFDTGIIPSPGLILVELDPVNNQMGDIYLPVSKEDAPNTGTVIEVGPELILENGQIIKFPHAIGDRVIFRKFSANMHVNVQGQKFYFLLFNDVLGRFKK